MASPTQTVVGKGTPNPLIAEGLLKILSGPDSTLSPPKSLTNSHTQNCNTPLPEYVLSCVFRFFDRIFRFTSCICFVL